MFADDGLLLSSATPYPAKFLQSVHVYMKLPLSSSRGPAQQGLPVNISRCWLEGILLPAVIAPAGSNTDKHHLTTGLFQYRDTLYLWYVLVSMDGAVVGRS